MMKKLKNISCTKQKFRSWPDSDQKAMKYGTDKEIDGPTTLSCKVLPFSCNSQSYLVA